jgi:hypothetical protein
MTHCRQEDWRQQSADSLRKSNDHKPSLDWVEVSAETKATHRPTDTPSEIVSINCSHTKRTSDEELVPKPIRTGLEFD